MDKEKEIEEIARLMCQPAQYCETDCTDCIVSKPCYAKRQAKTLVNAGYGNVKQAVKEFAEAVLKEFDLIEEHCL